MRFKPLDVAVFIPLIPAIPVLITWYLPWEEWIPKRIPKSIIGSYILYCAFAAWYFRMPGWFVFMATVFGLGICAVAIYERCEHQGE